MKIKLFTNNSLENYIDKSLTFKKECDIVFLSEQNTGNLRITLKENYTDVNYCKIGNIYYFIRDKIVKNNSLFIYDLEIDVLMSFKNDIKESNCKVIQCVNNFDVNNVRYEEKSVKNRLVYNYENPFLENKTVVLVGV